jgi:hypothetical protein
MQTIIGQWLQSLRHYVYLCLLSSSPERLPFNPYAFALTLLAYFGLAALLVDETRGYGAIAAHLLLELAMLAALARGALRLKNMPHRFPQTYSALVGINLVITAVSALLQYLVGADSGEPGALAFYLFIAILVWNLAAMSLVFKRALEISTPASAMLSFGYFVLYYILVVSFL